MADTSDSNSSAEQYDVALGDGEIQQHQQQQQSAAKTLHLRWTNLLKSVETKDDANNDANVKRGSIQSKITQNATKSKVILDRVSGEARPGEILATMVRTHLYTHVLE